MALDTATVGPKTFTITAADRAGNRATVTRSYRVVYPFTGFLSPVDNPPVLNTVNAGRAVPIKFSLGGDHGLAIFAPSHPSVTAIDCATGAPVDEVEQTLTAGQSTLTYDPTTAQYTYVWKTDSAWAGTCRRLTVRYTDGTTKAADFKLR